MSLYTFLCLRNIPSAANLPTPAYNSWNQNELQRWLADYNVPFSKTADRKDLESLVKKNWQSKVSAPYSDWDPAQLKSFLTQRGVDTKAAAAVNKHSLLEQVRGHWFETEEKAEDAWGNVKEWIFDRWVNPRWSCRRHTDRFEAGQIRNSSLSRINMVSPCLNLASAILFFSRFDKTTKQSPRKLVILLATLEIGFMRPGPNLVSYYQEIDLYSS